MCKYAPDITIYRAEVERICWDPKDGELYLSRMKPEEILVEVRSNSDVQIDRLTLEYCDRIKGNYFWFKKWKTF
ncbi:Uncharacterized protein ACO02O_02128 [Dirofilaria immitis]